jgi:acetate CoA/acetoacetate CoA-transferase beta subunit
MVTDLAAIGFPDGRATLVEWSPGVRVAQIVAATAAELVVAGNALVMPGRAG